MSNEVNFDFLSCGNDLPAFHWFSKREITVYIEKMME